MKNGKLPELGWLNIVTQLDFPVERGELVQMVLKIIYLPTLPIQTNFVSNDMLRFWELIHYRKGILCQHRFGQA